MEITEQSPELISPLHDTHGASVSHLAVGFEFMDGPNIPKDEFESKTRSFGYDFCILPILKPELNQSNLHDFFPSEQISEDQSIQIANNGIPGYISEKYLYLSTPPESVFSIARVSPWLDLDSSDLDIRRRSEILFRQQIALSVHISIQTICISCPLGSETNNVSIVNLARNVSGTLRTLQYAELCLCISLGTESPQSNSLTAWQSWNLVRNLTHHHQKLKVGLRLPANASDAEAIRDWEWAQWLSEPLKMIFLPLDVFLRNQKGYPVLSKRLQGFIRKALSRKVSIILSSDGYESLTPSETLPRYQEYIRYLNRTREPSNRLSHFVQDYQDFLQTPLQPLMDNLDNETYRVFEADHVKYDQYEKAIYRALLDRVPETLDSAFVIMVVGAGRGPLVGRALQAAMNARRNVRVYAIEKNPNALPTLEMMNARVWEGKVTIVHTDMRYWNPPEKADILVSELLGSFGDNELSPECCDGAQKLLKDKGISIPSSYTSYISPISSATLYHQVMARKNPKDFETPHVVFFQSINELRPAKPVWSFEHPLPPTKHIYGPESPHPNVHNERYACVEFSIYQETVIHGLGGYFEAVLYQDVMLSIVPETWTQDMYSWFPCFFPLKAPIHLPPESKIQVHMWRISDSRKVWYEWSVIPTSYKGVPLNPTEIHNQGGHAYWIGL